MKIKRLMLISFMTNIKDGNIDMLINKGLLDPITFKASSTPEEIFELHQKEDIFQLMDTFDVTRLDYVATRRVF